MSVELGDEEVREALEGARVVGAVIDSAGVMDIVLAYAYCMGDLRTKCNWHGLALSRRKQGWRRAGFMVEGTMVVTMDHDEEEKRWKCAGSGSCDECPFNPEKTGPKS